MWHRLHYGREWSGQLLYTKTSANMFDYANIRVDALDFIPYDLGDATYTNINLHNGNIANILDYIPDYWSDERCEDETKSVMKGVIHTHHNMSTFFSSTDQPNLLNNAANFVGTMYVSLIVNRDYDWKVPKDRWKARIAWHTQPHPDKKNVHCLYHDDEILAELNSPAVFWAECDVMFPYEAGECLDNSRFASLNPKYIGKTVNEVYCNNTFMGEFYKRLTGGKFEKMDGEEFARYFNEYADIYEWFVDETTAIMDKLCREYDLDTVFTTKLGLQITPEFVKVKMVSTMLYDLRTIGKSKRLDKFKIKFGNLIKML